MKYFLQKVDVGLICISIVFSLLNVAGFSMFYRDTLPWNMGVKENLLAFTAGIVFFGAFYGIGSCFLHFPDNGFKWKKEKPGKLTDRSENSFGLTDFLEQHIFAVAFFVIFLSYLPWMICYYPASMDWDVYRQLCSFLGIWPPSNHDPWISSCCIGFCYLLGVKLGSENLGIFLYILIRNLIMAAIYAGCISMLQNVGVKKRYYFLALAFYAITPVWGAYAKHAFKDTACASLFCLYIVVTICLVRQYRQNKLSVKWCAYYALAGLAVSLFRNNCIYAVAPATLWLLLQLRKEKQFLKYAIVLSSCIVIYLGLNAFFFNVLHLEKPSVQEAIAIPMQQTARTVRDYGDSLTDAEKKAIDECLGIDTLAERYDPILSDPVKFESPGNISKEVKINYAVTWLKMLPKYPKSYIEAAIAQSYGYYAFTPKQPAGAGNSNSGMTIFHWIKVKNFQDYFDFHYVKAFAKGREVLKKWPDIWQKIPVLHLTNAIALYTWTIVLLGYWLIRKKRWPELTSIVALVFMILTCIASPVNDCFRYYAPIAASVPALLALTSVVGRGNGDVKNE